MNAIFTAAKEVCDFMKARRWKFCVIGGLAVQRWGELRTTLDADLTLFTGFGDEEKYVDALLGQFAARTPEARGLALSRRVLLIRATNGKDAATSCGNSSPCANSRRHRSCLSRHGEFWRSTRGAHEQTRAVPSLRSPHPVIWCLARGLYRQIPSKLMDCRPAVAEGRLVMVTPFPDSARHITAKTATTRNRLVVEMAAAVVVAHAAPGSKMEALCRDILAAGKPLYTFDHPSNAVLLAAGARRVDTLRLPDFGSTIAEKG
jgi:hypothetical protein